MAQADTIFNKASTISVSLEAQQSCHLLQTNSQWRKKGQRGQGELGELGALEQATNLSEPVADKSKGICVPKLSEEEHQGLVLNGLINAKWPSWFHGVARSTVDFGVMGIDKATESNVDDFIERIG